MGLLVRPARLEDEAAAVQLLYESAAPYYEVFAGSEERALRLLHAVWGRSGHTASWDRCRVAELDGEVVGVLVAFPASEGDAMARRFLRLTLPRLPWTRLPRLFRHLRAAAVVTPTPPRDALYIDALAVADGARRQGVARRLLAEAEAMAVEERLPCVALDTGLDNHPARRLYETSGYLRREVLRAPDERVARAVGGSGFISYLKST